jgi:hypothetical protein
MEEDARTRQSKLIPLLEQFRLFEHELSLYGDSTLHVAGGRLVASIANFSALSSFEVDADAATLAAADRTFRRALEDFTELARGDTNAPGAGPHRLSRRRVSGRWNKPGATIEVSEVRFGDGSGSSRN